MSSWQKALINPRQQLHEIPRQIDGNKRVAAAVTETFLESNGSQLRMTDEEIVRLFLDIAAGLLSRDSVERLFRARIG